MQYIETETYKDLCNEDGTVPMDNFLLVLASLNQFILRYRNYAIDLQHHKTKQYETADGTRKKVLNPRTGKRETKLKSVQKKLHQCYLLRQKLLTGIPVDEVVTVWHGFQKTEFLIWNFPNGRQVLKDWGVPYITRRNAKASNENIIKPSDYCLHLDTVLRYGAVKHFTEYFYGYMAKNNETCLAG